MTACIASLSAAEKCPQGRQLAGAPRPQLASCQRRRAVLRRAKFQEFGAAEKMKEENGALADPEKDMDGPEPDMRDDRVLPGDLDDAIRQAGKAAARFCATGGTRAIVELQLPELENLSEEGAQQRLWDCSHLFLSSFQEAAGMERVRAVYPDAGVAAMLSYRWADASFGISSVNDRRPVGEDDEAVVLVAPDHTLLPSVERIASTLAAEDGLTRPLIMWNARLISGDVGIGLNVRRLKESFLNSFTTVYALRPLSAGAVFRCYPEPWLLFRDDPSLPGRYLLVRQQGARPDSDDIEELILAGESSSDGGELEQPSAAAQAWGILSSFSRFMRSLSK